MRNLAQGGTFVVKDLRPGPYGHGWDYEVTGYARDGQLLVRTVHRGKTSMQMECDAWRSRGAIETRNSVKARDNA